MWIGTEDHAQVLDGGLGKVTGVRRDAAQWRWAARAWPMWWEWYRRGFGWKWGKAEDDGLGDSGVA